MLTGQFELPISVDFAAVTLCALSGALLAIHKGYDFVGAFALALVTGMGGGLMRDSLFLRVGPPALVTNSGYILAVGAATALAIAFANLLQRYDKWLAGGFIIADALALGMFVVYGTQRGLQAGLDELAAMLIGVTNAVGGGILRDLLSNTEPVLFKPGQFYAAAAIIGALSFITLGVGLELRVELAAVLSVLITFGLRLGSVRYNWRTMPLCQPEPAPAAQPEGKR